MKICYVMNSPNWGGMEWHVVFLAEGMIAKGHQVFVWCPDGPIAEEFRAVDAEVITGNINLDLDPIYIFKLYNFLKQKHIDIVHAHELKAVINSLVAAALAGTKIRISHTHTPISEWPISTIKKKVNATINSTVVNWLATYEMALTPSRMRVKVDEGILKEKIKVIDSANGIKTEKFCLGEKEKLEYRKEILKRHGIPNDAFVWGTVGRISEEKGHMVLIEAFSELVKALPKEESKKHHLLLAGGGPLEDQIENRIKNSELENQITVTGRFATEDQVKYFSSLDVFIHPSLAEGWGIVLVEAMMNGTPVIASDLEVFKEVARETVTYFSVGNPTDLLNKSKQVYQNYDSAKKLALKAKEHAVGTYSFSKFTSSYEDFYLSLQGK